MNSIKKNFPIFNNNPDLVYLDNAATSQKPKILIDSLSDYYFNFNSNIGRGTYKLAELSEMKFTESKNYLKKFFSATQYEAIYTSGSTESLNFSARIAIQKTTKKYIVIPFLEHHANILIWQKISKDYGFEIYWVKEIETILNPELLPEKIKNNVAIFSFTHVSNVTGETFPINDWINLAKKVGAITILDGSQSVTSMALQIDSIDCDFFCFSAHKMYGPMGLGVVFMKKDFLSYEPVKLGGGIIEDVTLENYQLVDGVQRFEAGTPNVANIYAFSEVLKWLSDNFWSDLLIKTHNLNQYLIEELIKNSIQPIKISNKMHNTHISSFNLPGIHSHDVGTFLSNKNIAVRVGKHCAYPLHERLLINSSIRASVGIYNDKDDIDKLIQSLKDCSSYFKD